MGTPNMSLGEKLVQEGLITKDQYEELQAEEVKNSQPFYSLLINSGYLDELELLNFISSRYDLPIIEVEHYKIEPALIKLLPEKTVVENFILPIAKFGNRIICATADPWNVVALDFVRSKTNLIVEPVLASGVELKKAIERLYGKVKESGNVVKGYEGLEKTKEESEGNKPFTIRLVNLLLEKAIKEGASDIHLEPEESSLGVRYRVDGILYKQPPVPKNLQLAIISRIKILSDLDISEKRIPQDGRFHYASDKKEVDVRVSTVPTIYGENAVLRLLDVSSTFIGLKEIGFSGSILDQYERLIHQPHGIVLVTGPTGSGKTTTLYASVDKINDTDKKIITVEDPVEYRLEKIQQIQVNTKANLTFSSGLRSILRQDPDIIMVGEIRDKETAEIAIQSSLTGHLVLSTIHTNDAASSITRLEDMGIDPYLIASSLTGCLAQRLVRKVCSKCKGEGCAKCNKSGYKGRLGIFELLILSTEIKKLINSNASIDDIVNQARAEGMKSLKEDGFEKVKAGLTTESEVLRVTMET